MEGQQERRNFGEEEGGQPSRNSGQTVPKHMECRIMIDEISPRLEGGQPSRNSGQTVPMHMEYRIMIDEISPRLEGGQPSRNSGQTGPELEDHIIDEISPRVKKWIESVEKAKERTQSQTQWPRIPKVPEMLRGTQDFKKFYEPTVVSIGPYHHGKPHLQPGEMIKPLCAKKFLVDRKQMEDLYKKIKSKIKEVRSCYDWSSSNEYDDEELAWMMLQDGCFLLQFIRSRFDSTVDMSKVLRVHQIEFVDYDLFLLENQLPFGVLKLILEEAKLNDCAPMEEMIKNFVTAIASPERSTSEIVEEKDEEPSHLVDLLRSALLGKYKKIRGSQPEQERQAEKKGVSSSQGGDGGFCCSSKGKQQGKGESLSSQGEDGGFCCPWKKGKQGNRQSFRHIKELKSAGIHLQPSRTGFLTDISFNSYFFRGFLKLPQITIDDSTKPMFLNIVAYEMCPDAPDDYEVTSYICFLDDLIDHADDVKELRSKHILYNLLGSDEEVAKIFNEIANDLVDPDVYADVKDRIQKHYDKRVNTWIAQALHDHFSTPWTIMAFIAAVVIILFTGFQTFSFAGKSK